MRRWLFLLGTAALIVLISFSPIPSGVYAYATARKVVATLENFEVKSSGDSTCNQKYLVWTNAGSFENTDSGWWLKWNSTDVQAALTKLKGKQVVLYFYGFRWPYRSWYPNIYRFELPKSE